VVVGAVVWGEVGVGEALEQPTKRIAQIKIVARITVHIYLIFTPSNLLYLLIYGHPFYICCIIVSTEGSSTLTMEKMFKFNLFAVTSSAKCFIHTSLLPG